MAGFARRTTFGTDWAYECCSPAGRGGGRAGGSVRRPDGCGVTEPGPRLHRDARGGVARSWQRAVNEARRILEQEQDSGAGAASRGCPATALPSAPGAPGCPVLARRSATRNRHQAARSPGRTHYPPHPFPLLFFLSWAGCWGVQRGMSGYRPQPDQPGEVVRGCRLVRERMQTVAGGVVGGDYSPVDGGVVASRPRPTGVRIQQRRSFWNLWVVTLRVLFRTSREGGA